MTYQCPFSQALQPTLARLRVKFPEQLRFAIKHLPMPYHRDAKLGARAAEAARAQGKFWAFHDALFANPGRLNDKGVLMVAQDLMLNMKKFEEDLASPQTAAAVEADLAEAAELGVTGSPTTAINGRLVTGAQPLQTFEQTIAAELEALK